MKKAHGGVHLIEKLYSSSYPQSPKWVTGWNEERWSKLGVVVWDSQIHLVTHFRGSEALDLLFQLQQSDAWKREGLVVGETVYTIPIPNNTNSKKRKQDQEEEKSEKKDGWHLTNTIQLSPDQTKQFFLFLEENEEKLHNIVDEEESERRKILGKVYSLILSWRKERLKNNPASNTNTEQQTNS